VFLVCSDQAKALDWLRHEFGPEGQEDGSL
jgi:hypothetical protein